MADLPELDNKDRPTGVIEPTALSISWFQRCLDHLHQEFPWAGTIASQNSTVVTLNTLNFAPADFILDVRHGLLLNLGGTTKRLIRRSFQEILTLQALHDQGAVGGGGGAPMTGQPTSYCFLGRDLRLDVTPQSGGFPTQLWYYKMPGVLAGSDIPNFPSDHVLVDFVYMRALEWARKQPQGSAWKYLRDVEVAALRESGLAQEPEHDLIPLDPTRFRGTNRTPLDWMGSTRPNI
jgi:hypothetical protein